MGEKEVSVTLIYLLETATAVKPGANALWPQI